MKRYKLVKDLPTFNAGDVFYLSEGGNLLRGSDRAMAYNWSEIEKFPNILTDWFEEIKEPTRWKPEDGEAYHYICSDGKVYDDVWANGSIIDNGRFDIGNCFKTREEAERVAEYLKALAVVRGDATTKFTKGDPNWYVCYDAADNSLRLGSTFLRIWNGIFGLPYFASEDEAQRSIEQHKSEWLTLFGIEEEECD